MVLNVIKKPIALFFLLCLSATACAIKTIPPSSTMENQPPAPVPTLPTVVPTVTLIPAQIASPIATYSSQGKRDIVNNLLLNNGNCRYPCWWGFVPGTMPWSEMASFYIRLGATIIPFNRGPEVTHYYVEFDVDGKKIVNDLYVDGSGILEVVLVSQEIAVHEFFVSFGKPSEIWFYSDGDVPGPSFARVILSYPDKGMQVMYWAKSDLTKVNSKNSIITCVDDFAASSSLWLWSPSEKFDLQDVLALTEKLPDMKFRRLEEVTNFVENDFFDSISLHKPNICLETPAAIWPLP